MIVNQEVSFVDNFDIRVFVEADPYQGFPITSDFTCEANMTLHAIASINRRMSFVDNFDIRVFVEADPYQGFPDLLPILHAKLT